MKTTVDIPERELKDLMRLTKAATKKEAIVTAVADFNRRKKMAELTKYLGQSKGDGMMSLEELMDLRARGTHTF
ncbi:MAG: DUF2191 domain-containing protein [Verrucomicrobia bacterium]|nr:DUF2191 domain-containing protein [Verrucomicrobiota bacterium]